MMPAVETADAELASAAVRNPADIAASETTNNTIQMNPQLTKAVSVSQIFTIFLPFQTSGKLKP